MELFRVFDWDGASLGLAEGGPLFVARDRQGAGRHDRPERYGAWYCSREAVSAVAESIQFLRGATLDDDDFVRPGERRKALVSLRLEDVARIVDLDDPAALAARRLRPSRVATIRRAVTQPIALSLFEEGADGLSWWSVLNADWTNVTLFHERVLSRVAVAAPPRSLSVRLAEVREAAERLGISL